MVEDASYKKLREASLAYHLGNVPGMNGDWTVSVVGRNLKTWTRYTGFDPEVGFGAVSGSGLSARSVVVLHPSASLQKCARPHEEWRCRAYPLIP